MKKIIAMAILIIGIVLSTEILCKDETNVSNNVSTNTNDYINTSNIQINIPEKINIIDDWRLTLVNYEYKLPEDFKIELEYIDTTRQFDSRAIDELNKMLKDTILKIQKLLVGYMMLFILAIQYGMQMYHQLLIHF